MKRRCKQPTPQPQITAPSQDEELRDHIIGMGGQSMRKSYYPVLRKRLQELERNRQLLDHALEGIFFLEGPNLIFSDANKSARKLLDINNNSSLKDILNSVSMEAISSWLEKPSTVSQDHLVLCIAAKTGTKEDRWLELSLSSPEDKTSGMLVGVVSDITEKRKNAETLRISEERLSMALNAATDGLWDYNLEKQIHYYSPNYFRMLGYEPDEFEPGFETWAKMVNQKDKNVALDRFRAYLAGKIPYYSTEYRMRAKDGSWKWIFSRGSIVHRDKHGNPLRVVGTHVDITEKKNAAEALRLSEERLRVTMNSIGDAVLATDTKGNVVLMNPVAESLTGWASNEATGKHVSEVFKIINGENREPAFSPVEKVIATGETVGLASHTMLVNREGREFQIADSGAPIRNDSGEIIGVVLVFRDITEEYALQERLRQSQKMEAIGNLAGGIAHDFNNMLCGILGAAELLAQAIEENNQTKKLMNIIHTSAQRAADLTAQLLTFSRKKEARLKTTAIQKPLNDAINLIERTIDKRINIELALDQDPHFIIGDESMLQNVFLNLMINSSHAMPDGGNLFISCRQVELDESQCKSSQFRLSPGAFVEVEIRDTGCGIPQENLSRIFEPFFTTKPVGTGTGLGLSTVFGTVQQHNGAINIYSEEGIGTCVRVLLPIQGESQAETNALALEPIPGTGVILIVDDEAVMRTTAQMILEKLGYEVLIAENGLLGVEQYRNNQEKIDLVILDMIMPEMNGRECFSEIIKINPRANVLLASGFTKEDDLNAMKAGGLKGFINKPFHTAQLSHIVYDTLNPSNKKTQQHEKTL